MDTLDTPLEQLPPAPAEKRCLKCGLTKPIEDFPCNGDGGRKARCKICHCAAVTAYYRANKDRINAAQREARAKLNTAPRTEGVKRCARCGETKAVERFGRRRASTDGLHSYCLDCARALARTGTGPSRSEQKMLAKDGLKRCRVCLVVQPLAAFFQDQVRTDGRIATCRSCQGAYRRDRRLAARKASLGDAYGEKERLLEQGLKRCSACKEVKALAAFGAYPPARDGHEARCLLCRREAQKRSRAEHPERHKAADRVSYQRHRGKRIAAAKTRYEANKDAKRAYNRTYRTLNWERLRAQRQRRYAEHRAEILARGRAGYVRHRERRIANEKARYSRRREQARAQRRQHYIENREAIIAKVKQYAARHPEIPRTARFNRRSRLRGSQGRVRARDIDAIYTAQRGRCAYCLAVLVKPYHKDHMTAISAGGLHAPENICLTCSTCNRRKGKKSAGVFLGILLREARAQRAQAAV